MHYLSDLLLMISAFGAAAFCAVLSVRLKRFATLEKGMGAAVMSLSKQVQELQAAVIESRAAGETALLSLERERRRAEDASRRIEVLLGALHDFPEKEESAA